MRFSRGPVAGVSLGSAQALLGAAIASNRLTIEARWVGPLNVPGTNTFGNLVRGGASANSVLFRPWDAIVRLEGPGQSLGVTAPVVAPALYERHVAIVWDGTSLVQYLDGVEVVRAVGSGGAFKPAAENVAIGIAGDGVSEPFEGSIRDVRLWSVARTADEIRRGIRDGIEGDELGLIAWYPLLTDAKDYALRPVPKPIIETFTQANGFRRYTDSGHYWAYLYNPTNELDASGGTNVLDGSMHVPDAYGSNFLYTPGSNNRRATFTVRRWPTDVLMAQMRMTPADGSCSIQFNAGNITAYDTTGALGTVTWSRASVVLPARVTVEVDGMTMRAWVEGVLIGTWTIKSVPPSGGFVGTLFGFGGAGVVRGLLDDLTVDFLPPTPFHGVLIGSPRPQLALQR